MAVAEVVPEVVEEVRKYVVASFPIYVRNSTEGKV